MHDIIQEWSYGMALSSFGKIKCHDNYKKLRFRNITNEKKIIL